MRIQSNSVSTTAVGSSTKAESLGLSAKARPRSGRCPWPSRTRPGRPCLGERKELGPGFRLWSQRTSDFGGWSGHTATSLDLFDRVMYEASIDGSGSSVKELHSLRIRLMWLSKNNEARASGQMSPVAYELAGVL